MNFQKECEKWLSPMGFTKCESVNDGQAFVFTNPNEEHFPAIHCWKRDSNKFVQITDVGAFAMFLSLQTSVLRFKNKHMEQYIKAFAHYSRLARENPLK